MHETKTMFRQFDRRKCHATIKVNERVDRCVLILTRPSILLYVANTYGDINK